MSKKDFTAKHLTKMGSNEGQSVTGRAVQKDWAKAQLDGNWFPGKKSGNKGGRPPRIIQAQKQAIASKAMEPKDEIIPPTPDKIRICLPRKTINKEAVAASEGTEGRQASPKFAEPCGQNFQAFVPPPKKARFARPKI